MAVIEIPHLRHEYIHPMPIVNRNKNTTHFIAAMPKMESRHATNFKLVIDWHQEGVAIEG